MASLDELAKKLSNFGITFNQAKVYIVTAKLGIASVSQISKESNVAREEVYRLLPKLEKLGLIEKTVEKPRRIKATFIRSVLSILIKREQDTILKKISKLEANKDEVLSDFRTLKMKSKSKEEPHLTLISQKDATIKKMLSMIDAAKRTIDIVIAKDQFIHFFTSHSLPIKEALSRGLKFHVILEKAEYDNTIVRLLEKFESPEISFSIRFVDQQSSHYFLVDYREALIATSTEFACLGKRPCLWTDESNLVKLIIQNFETMWLTSRDIETLKSENINEKLIRVFDSLQPTDHILLIYRSLEAKYNVLCNYLKVGLEKGEVTVYIVSEEKLGQIRDVLKRFGIEVEKNEKAGALRIVGYNEFYIIDGNFNISTTTSLIKQMYDEALKKGFRGCRVFGEMSCFFHCNWNHKLIDYEKSLHRILNVPIIGMCAYNANLFEKVDHPVELYNELLKTHGTVLFTGLDKHLGKFEIRKLNEIKFSDSIYTPTKDRINGIANVVYDKSKLK